ncbi:PQQ-like beta-propeller repeat protein [Bythopirellula polymerisocia]|uniref:Serine/threonine-protein kinase AfsK n=1 Tax=Bythopirellula polymerisocia TaxID=2528003 RepID=A0A5C6CJL4_9BACT|nr:PQQ-like beta-propeller repeat protein [Bythopirellula polymerisocia]TWU23674.1 Serine/threonine-protein kinase AfsK [Bythopirellula polymerisocia]
MNNQWRTVKVLWLRLATCLAVLFGVLASSGIEAGDDPLDWPNWRGPQKNNVSMEKGLVESWDPEGGPGSNLLWKNDELGGRSTPIVMNGLLYTIVRDQPGTEFEAEKVVCVDAATGEKHWEYRMNLYLCEVPDTRVGWSCCTGDPETDRIYVQSVSGYFCCLEGKTGKLVWDRSLLEEFGLINTYGGRTNVPVIFEDQVLISAVVVGWGDAPKFGFLARPAHRFMSLDKATGVIRWMNGTGISPYDTTYSTPVVTVLGGQAALVFGSGDGEVWALQPRTGQPIWHYPLSRRGLNTSPLVEGNTVYYSQSEENVIGSTMGALVAIDGAMTGDLSGKEKWFVPQIMSGKSSPVMVDGKLWTVDDRAKLYVFDPETGEQLDKQALGTAMRSTPLVADGKVYTCTNAGRWYILKPTGDGVEIVHKLRLGGDNDGSPIVSHGRIYLPTSDTLYCIGDTRVTPSADPLPPQPQETPVDDDSQTALVQVEPYDVLLAPGGKQSYHVRLYNSRGQFLRKAAASEVSFGVDGPGSVSADGTYTAPAGNEHQVALVTCKVGELMGTARIRVVPPLPWSFDFNDDEDVPLTWIGGRVRYVLRDEDGERFAVKRDVLPTPKDPHNKLGTRSQLTMGPVDMANYTIEADFALDEQDGKLPDFGLTNSRYSMTVRPMNEELRIYSWSPHDYRTNASVEFKPQAHKWYTMKMRVDPVGSKAIVRGKLWPRGEAEPEDWTVEMEDFAPNLFGSPGLFGKAEVAEIFVDNIKVYPNQ